MNYYRSCTKNVLELKQNGDSRPWEAWTTKIVSTTPLLLSDCNKEIQPEHKNKQDRSTHSISYSSFEQNLDPRPDSKPSHQRHWPQKSISSTNFIAYGNRIKKTPETSLASLNTEIWVSICYVPSSKLRCAWTCGRRTLKSVNADDAADPSVATARRNTVPDHRNVNIYAKLCLLKYEFSQASLRIQITFLSNPRPPQKRQQPTHQENGTYCRPRSTSNTLSTPLQLPSRKFPRHRSHARPERKIPTWRVILPIPDLSWPSKIYQIHNHTNTPSAFPPSKVARPGWQCSRTLLRRCGLIFESKWRMLRYRGIRCGLLQRSRTLKTERRLRKIGTG